MFRSLAIIVILAVYSVQNSLCATIAEPQKPDLVSANQPQTTQSTQKPPTQPNQPSPKESVAKPITAAPSSKPSPPPSVKPLEITPQTKDSVAKPITAAPGSTVKPKETSTTNTARESTAKAITAPPRTLPSSPLKPAVFEPQKPMDAKEGSSTTSVPSSKDTSARPFLQAKFTSADIRVSPVTSGPFKPAHIKA